MVVFRGFTEKLGDTLMRTLLFTLAITCSGCGIMGDGVIVYGTPEGIRSLYDGQNALITNAKTQLRDGNSAAWKHRAAQEQEITKRRSFLDKMMYGFIEPEKRVKPTTNEGGNY